MIPQRDESLLGYLKRHSDAEGYPDLGGFLSDIGYSYGRPLVENAENLAVALGVCTRTQFVRRASPQDTLAVKNGGTPWFPHALCMAPNCSGPATPARLHWV